MTGVFPVGADVSFGTVECRVISHIYRNPAHPKLRQEVIGYDLRGPSGQVFLGIKPEAVSLRISDLQDRFNYQLAAIHAGNVTAGWWSDLKTGQSILLTRNRGEILMLVVTALSEASYGRAKCLADDKLPHLPMYAVELADTAIRLFDVIGAENQIHPAMPPKSVVAEVGGRKAYLQRRSTDECLMLIVNEVSKAMEHYRKARIAPYREALRDALYMVIALAERDGVPLFDVIEAKRQFNAVRPDHKRENRLAVGGKVC